METEKEFFGEIKIHVILFLVLRILQRINFVKLVIECPHFISIHYMIDAESQNLKRF